MQRMITLLTGVALVYGLILALLWWGQERLLFLPTRLAPDHHLALERDVHERWIDVPGARLHALHLKLPAPRGVVFYLHGNAENLEGWFVDLDVYRRANFDLFMIDYRGYGKSSGRIDSEAQLHADVRAAWDAVAPMYEGRRRVLLGCSLGSGLAAHLAAQVQPELTVLVSPYSSMRALAAEHYWWVPSWVLRYPLASDRAIASLRTPLLLLHGERDDLIGPHHAEALHRAQPQARLHIVSGTGHNDLQSSDAYRKLLGAALDAI
jgi:uncharacterized protein